LQLLERFEIALSLGDKTRLIPSMLPMDRPAMNFEPTFVPAGIKVERSFTYVPKDRNLPKKVVNRGNTVSGTMNLPPEKDDRESQSVSFNKPGEICSVRRRYKMAYIPSGFWSRLISRLMINLKRAGISTRGKRGKQESDFVYWRRGIAVFHSTGRFLVEAAHSQSTEVAGVCVGHSMHQSIRMPSDGDRSTQGVDVTVWSYTNDFSPMGYIVDQIDALIDEWFPGECTYLESFCMCTCVKCIHWCVCVRACVCVCVCVVIMLLNIVTGLNEADQYGDSLIERQVPWVVPDHLYSPSPPLRPNTNEYDDDDDDYDDDEFEKEKKVSRAISNRGDRMIQTIFCCIKVYWLVTYLTCRVDLLDMLYHRPEYL